MRRTVRTAGRPEHEIIGRLLRQAREERGLSQRDVAQALDRTQAFVWKLESGFQHVDIPTLIDLCRLYREEPAELMQRLSTELASDSQ